MKNAETKNLRDFSAGNQRLRRMCFEVAPSGCGPFATCVFSVSASKIPEVEKYIAGQEEHHRKQTFQEEYLEFLEKHGVEYDKRYVWD